MHLSTEHFGARTGKIMTSTYAGNAAHSTRYALCQSDSGTKTSPFHIRSITGAGFKTGGGADTVAVCGAKVDWDRSELFAADLPRTLAMQHRSFVICALCASDL
jgi:hypothetical protein